MELLLFQRPAKERKEIWEQILVDKAFRLLYFKFDFYAWAIYYFWHNFITWIKDFHKMIYLFCVDPKNAIIIWFRESWKTAIVALLYVVWCIATKREDFILFMAYDLDSAKDKVLNVSNFLRSNKKFKLDYWLLYDDWTSRGKQALNQWSQQKTMSKFVTTTWIKVEAVSLKNMKRWKQLLDDEWNIIRPSLLIADDLDIEESVKNKRIIEENTAKINSWVLRSIRWKAIFLWNIITIDWIIQRLEETYKGYWNTMRIALIEKGEIIWPERYVWTQKEAEKLNNELYQGKKVVQSIEVLSIDKESYNCDFLNLPKMIVWDPIFDTEAVIKCEELTPYFTFKIKVEDREAELNIYYKDFRKDFFDYLYAWVDTWWWQWWDSDNTSMTFLDKNGDLYATLASNIINYSHARQILSILHNQFWFHFFNNSLWIEKNFTWIALIEDIKTYNSKDLLKKCFIPTAEGKKITQYTNVVWWFTSWSSKEKLKEDLRKAIIQNKIKFEEDEKEEFKFWVKTETNWKIVYEPDWINCDHDDRIISRWIAFQMFLNNNPNFLKYE